MKEQCKINKEAKYFKQVARILGEEEAEKQLNIVLNSPITKLDDSWGASDCCLISLFSWGDSPQNHTFWSDIDAGFIPSYYNGVSPKDKLTLSKEDSEAFVEALENPKPMNERLMKATEKHREMIKPKPTTKNKPRTSNLMTFHYKSGHKATVRGITELTVTPKAILYISKKHNQHKGFVVEHVEFRETNLIDYLELDFVGQDKKQIVFETSVDQMTFGEIKIFERQLKEIPDQVFTFNIDK